MIGLVKRQQGVMGSALSRARWAGCNFWSYIPSYWLLVISASVESGKNNLVRSEMESSRLLLYKN